jgi:hypothetical protein
MNFPAPFANILRERIVCVSMLLTGIVFIGANMLGLRVWICVFRETTGLPCPGCGMTRAMSSLAKGNLASAMHYHLLSPIIFVGLLVMTIVTLLPQSKRQLILPLIEKAEHRSGFTALSILAMLAYGIWRIIHLHSAPGTWLPS